MSQFKIICDSACDLPKETIKDNDIDIVSFYVTFDDHTYYKEHERTSQEFYQQLVDNPSVYPKTSMPTVDDYQAIFEKYAALNMPIICVCISSKISGSYNGACLARETCLEKYKDAKIAVIDSYLLTGVEGMLANELIKMNQDNVSFDEAIKKIEEIKHTGRAYFTIGSLDYLSQGGRIGKLKSAIGSVLRVKPIIVFKHGEVNFAGIALTRNKALTKIIDSVKAHFKKNNYNYEDFIFRVGHGYSLEEAQNYASRVQKEFNLPSMSYFQIGATVAVHTGPYPIGIAFIKKYRD